MLTIIVAMDDQQLIGREGGLPWQIPEDLKYFKETTLHHSLLVGHQTLKGLPRLNDRKIYGVSRHPIASYQQKDVCWVVDPLAFMEAKKELDEEIFVAGGANLYAQALPFVDRLLISRIHGIYEGDTYFPKFNEDEYELVEKTPLSSKVTVYDYRRKVRYAHR